MKHDNYNEKRNADTVKEVDVTRFFQRNLVIVKSYEVKGVDQNDCGEKSVNVSLENCPIQKKVTNKQEVGTFKKT